MRIAVSLIAACALIHPFDLVRAESPTVDLGRTYTQLFYDGDVSSLWERMTDQMRGALGSESALSQFQEQVVRELGPEKRIIDERVEKVQGYRVYVRQAQFAKTEIPIIVNWSFDSDDRIAGFFVRPQQKAALSPYLEYETKASLRLPFDGEWFIFWGGRTIEENYHAVASDQRFAYDMVVHEDGKSHSGDGTSLDQYYCWGKPILAPGNGVVLVAVANLPDNPPGVTDARNPPGNHLVLDLGNAEYALLAHFQNGSITVDAGDQVSAGDVLGRCGNSGNTSEPHLHFHIQDGSEFGAGKGKPAFFENYLSNGVPVNRGEPTRGEYVRSAAALGK